MEDQNDPPATTQGVPSVTTLGVPGATAQGVPSALGSAAAPTPASDASWVPGSSGDAARHGEAPSPPRLAAVLPPRLAGWWGVGALPGVCRLRGGGVGGRSSSAGGSGVGAALHSKGGRLADMVDSRGVKKGKSGGISATNRGTPPVRMPASPRAKTSKSGGHGGTPASTLSYTMGLSISLGESTPPHF